MKYVVIIPDGAADLPLDELEGRTPLEAADTPNMDALANAGRVGTVRTTPDGFEAGSDICCMSLLGYDPAQYHSGRAPIEAAALGIEAGPSDWLMRVNLVTTRGPAGGASGGIMVDHSAGGIDDIHAKELVDGLWAYWSAQAPDLVKGLELRHGVSYRSILKDASGRDYAGVETIPPHEIPGEQWKQALPTALTKSGQEAAQVLVKLMELSVPFLAAHPINAAREAAGENPATMAWVWGQGVRPAIPSFESLHGVKGAMITAVDLLDGLAELIGWDRLAVEGLSSYHWATDYAAQGAATCEAIGDYDIVCCHVESPDEASHQEDWESKVGAIEAIDEHIIGPVSKRLREFGDPETSPADEGWRMLVLPDHYTLVSTRRHDATPVPFMMAGAWIRSVVDRTLTEADAQGSDLHIGEGHELMEYFLRGGLARVGGGPMTAGGGGDE